MDRATLTRRFQEARDRLREGVSPAAGGLGAYLHFQDALAAAGLARGLGEDDDSVRELLALAGVAAVTVFGAGPLEMEVGDLDTGEVERRVDTSLANPTTLLQGLHAALAGGHQEAAERLAALSPERYRSDQAPASELLTTTARTLQLAALGDRRGVISAAAGVAGRSLDATPDEQVTLVAQVQALAAWAGGEPFDLDIAAAAERVSWLAIGRDEDDPMVLLELPALGLAALPWESPGAEPG